MPHRREGLQRCFGHAHHFGMNLEVWRECGGRGQPSRWFVAALPLAMLQNLPLSFHIASHTRTDGAPSAAEGRGSNRHSLSLPPFTHTSLGPPPPSLCPTHLLPPFRLPITLPFPLPLSLSTPSQMVPPARLTAEVLTGTPFPFLAFPLARPRGTSVPLAPCPPSPQPPDVPTLLRPTPTPTHSPIHPSPTPLQMVPPAGLLAEASTPLFLARHFPHTSPLRRSPPTPSSPSHPLLPRTHPTPAISKTFLSFLPPAFHTLTDGAPSAADGRGFGRDRRCNGAAACPGSQGEAAARLRHRPGAGSSLAGAAGRIAGRALAIHVPPGEG